MNKIGKLLFGCLLVGCGILFLRHAHLVTGGTAGLALSLSYLVNFPFSVLFFLVNLPFYVLSVMRMGWSFTFSTLFAVTTLSFITGVDQWIPRELTIHPLMGSLVGGLAVGFGLCILFINRSSLGGANILAIYVQKRWGIDPGKFTFAFDSLVVLTGVYSVGFWNGCYSILSILVLARIISHYKMRIASRNVIRSSSQQYKPAV
ncbi:MAG TPA: YitT family protein [Bacillota bacterium]|nr:YitT family protein [Bacillota bacterium]